MEIGALVVRMLSITMMSFGAMSAEAQSPASRMTIVVPFPAGGPTDTLSRVVGEAITQKTGRIVIVDNRPGAGGQIAAGVVKQSPADSTTLFIGDWAILGSNAALYKNFGYDPLTDFQPVALAASFPMVLYVNGKNPATSVNDLVEQIRKQPATFGSQGPGTAGQLLGVMFQNAYKLDMTHVPYKGSAPAIQDLLGGNVSMVFDAVPAGYQYVKDGRLKALAVMSSKRSPLLPDVPTANELGIQNLNMDVWFGIVARPTMPKSAVAEVNKELVEALASEKVAARLKGMGFETATMSPEQFGSFMKSEHARWSQVIKANNITVD